MNTKFIKKLVKFTDEKTKKERSFYVFYIKLENGMTLKVLPNSYKDDKGETHSNYRELLLVATDDLPF